MSPLPLVAVTAAALVAALAGRARAEIITYNLAGQVTQAADQGTATPNAVVPVTVGQIVPIAVTVDTSFPNTSTTPGEGYYSVNFSTTASPILSATIDGQNVLDTITSSIVVYSGYSINIISASPQINAGFSLILSGAKAGVLPSTAIPPSLDPAGFMTATFSVTDLIAPTIIGYSGVIVASATAVPEPGSLALLASGAAGVAFALRRQRLVSS